MTRFIHTLLLFITIVVRLDQETMPIANAHFGIQTTIPTFKQLNILAPHALSYDYDQ